VEGRGGPWRTACISFNGEVINRFGGFRARCHLSLRQQTPGRPPPPTHTHTTPSSTNTRTLNPAAALPRIKHAAVHEPRRRGLQVRVRRHVCRVFTTQLQGGVNEAGRDALVN
jgi:hypothetical protein